MTLLIESFVTSAFYNSLPHIEEASKDLQEHAQDLQDLRKLLSKHNVANSVSIRLIHKHFDTFDGEVMAFEDVTLESYGTVQVMKPIVLRNAPHLQGVHFLVNDDGVLQAYEYSTTDLPEMCAFGPFMAEFCKLVSERGLKSKFGLKLRKNVNSRCEETSWTEFELHHKRSTILLAKGMPMPEGNFEVDIATEWDGLFVESSSNCKHNTACKHCRHCNHTGRQSYKYDGPEQLSLGGKRLTPGSPIHGLVAELVQTF